MKESNFRHPNFRHLGILGAAGLALGTLSVNIQAITADDVVCVPAGCVQSIDIANGTVSSIDIRNYGIKSVDMNPLLTLGSQTNGGKFAVKTTAGPGALVFEADGNSAVRSVRVGRGGAAATNEDTDLVVIDPFYAASLTEPVMQMDASTGTLYLGSGNGVTPGQGGELYIENGIGSIGVWLFGDGSAYLGNSGHSGTLFLDNGGASWSSIVLSGSSGNLTNQFAGNGLVKAWARINSTGTVASCYRCSAAAADTNRIVLGAYEVDFTPVGTDISGRPWTCSLGNGAVFGAIGQIGCVQRSGDPSSIFVDIRNTTGAAADAAFTVVVY
jgi:hypothetical protein